MTITFKSPEDIVEFVKTVSRYEYDMDMRKGRVVVDAKSVLGIMHLGVDSEILFQIHSDNCEDLQNELRKYLA